MVTLSKIYTKTGDGGTTRLVDNSEVRKTDVRVEAYGHVDEANSAIGLALALGGLPPRLVEMLRLIQNELFDVGSDLANPLDPEPKWQPLRIEEHSVERLEGYIDELQEGLEVLRSFILPTGTPAGAQLHVARSIARRAERAAWRAREEHGVKEVGGINPLAVRYLNRLSDLLFVMSRVANGTEHEVLWVPGTDREKPASGRH